MSFRRRESILSNVSHRAYNTLSHAIRHAMALGLHLVVTDRLVDPPERSRRAMTWYSLYSLEILLGEITGRPTSISVSNVTLPITILEQRQKLCLEQPAQLDEQVDSVKIRRFWVQFLCQQRENSQMMAHGPMPSTKDFATIEEDVPPSHFPHRLRLCHLSDKVGTQLYMGHAQPSWSEIQRRVRELQAELRDWLQGLPVELALQSSETRRMGARVKIELNMYYHSVQMILHRPCLCDGEIADESHGSQEFNHECARACVHAAMNMLAAIPDDPSAHEAYQMLPWWALLHYLGQAASVLLVELSLDSQHFQNEPGELIRHLKKAMAYLRCMAERSLSAYRLWRICRQLLDQVRPRYGDLDVADLPLLAPQPVGWTEEDENNIQNAFSRA